MASSPPDRRLLLLVGTVLVGAVAVFVLVLSGGSKGVRASGGSNPFNPPTPSPAPSAGRPAPPLVGRDPFQPPGTPAPTTPPPPGPTPSVSPAGSPPPAPGGGSSARVGGHTVVLDNIVESGGQKKAQVEVDAVVYTVAPGQRFAGGFQLMSINGGCANFRFTPQDFTLCVTPHK